MAQVWLMAGVAVALSGCVSDGDPAMFNSTQGFAPGAAGLSANVPLTQDESGFPSQSNEMTATADVPLPTPSPTAADAQSRAPATQTAMAQPLVQSSTGVDALNRGITQTQAASPGANLYSAASADPVEHAVVAPAVAEQAALAAPAPAQVRTTEIVTTESETAAAEPDNEPKVQELAVAAAPRKSSIFSRLFAPQAQAKRKAPSGTVKRVAAKPEPKRVVVASAATSSQEGLPGVSLAALFGLNGDDSVGQKGARVIEVASAAGLARLAPNGLRTQTDKVEVSCLKPQLVRVLKSVERHYGRPVVVTSGFRSPKHNRRIGGASGSRHTSCEAADIQVAGVTKWQLAKYLRAMPGRGGVGTYCHTKSVHIDIGNSRDWNWRCRRRK